MEEYINDPRVETNGLGTERHGQVEQVTLCSGLLLKDMVLFT